MEGAFSKDNNKNVKALEAKIKELEWIAGRMPLDNELLKKP